MTNSGNRTWSFAGAARRSAIVILMVISGGNCKAVPQATDGSTASEDGGPRDMSDRSTIQQDSRGDVPTPPWYDGSWLIPTFREDSGPSHDCPAGATTIPALSYERYLGGCEWNGYFLGPVGGYVELGVLGQSNFWVLGGTEAVQWSGRGACRSSSLVLYFRSSRHRADAILEFTEINTQSRVLWQAILEPYRMPSTISSGVHDLVATDSFIAWTFRPTPNGGAAPMFLYVAGPHGENPHIVKDLVTGASEFQLTASGDRFVYTEDYRLWTWTVGMEAPERLLPVEENMVDPWLDGNNLVWTDFRHDGGSAWAPNNTEIYWMDVRTRETRRITSDSPDRVAMQINPRVSGNWITWTDFRNAQQRVSASWLTDRQDIYGYHLPSQRERQLVPGGVLREPNLIGDHLYYIHAYPRLNEPGYREQTCVTSLQSLVQPRDQ